MTRVRRDQGGFALLELLVAATIGVVVLFAVGTLSAAFLHAQTRVSDRSESIARGRGAMEQIVQQLRSQVCLGPGYPAITYGDGSRMTFYADLANTTFVPEQRTLTFASGALTERTYPGATNTSGRGAPFTFAATPSRTRVVLDRVELVASGRTTTPFFRYYSFDRNDPIRPSTLLVTPLSAADAARVVQISVSFGAQPSRLGGNRAAAEPFTANVYVRTADPTDPEHSPLCI